MADNVPYVEDATVSIAADEIGGVKYQRVKLTLGIDGVNDGDVSSTNPVPVSLPATAATAAKQDTGNTSVASIDTKTPALGQALAAASVPIVLTAIQQAALTPPAAITGFALDATLTGGTAKAITRGGAKGATAAADLTGTAQGVDHQALDVQIYHGGAAKDPTQVRALTAADVVTAAQGPAAAVAGAWPVKLTDGTSTAAVKAASAAAAATDPSAVVQLSPNQPQLTTPLNVQGGKTNNNAAPGATNAGAIIGIANEALPSYTEGNLVMPALDLRGVLRSIGVPLANLGVYGIMFKTGTYGGLAANTPLVSWRWGDATRFCTLLRVRLIVITSVAASTAGITERQLIHARAFTASDTGGTSFLPTGNSQKRRTSMGTTLMTDMRAGAPITAGTRTLDGAAASSLAGWSGLLSTGLVIGACGSSAAGAARSTEGGTGYADLYNALNGQDYPQTYAQNEGSVIRIGAAEPTGATQETWGIVEWLEANKVL